MARSDLRIIGLVVLLLLAGIAAQAAEPVSELPFRRNYDAALREAHISGKPVVVFFEAAWCPICNQMKKTVFTQPAVLAMADDFVWVLVDIDRELSLSRSQEIVGVPTIRLLTAEGVRIDSHVGMIGATPLVDRLRTLGRPPGETTVYLRDQSGPASQLVWQPGGYRGSGICFSHVGYGPLSVSAQSSFQSLRLGLRPRTPSTLGKGQYEVQVDSTWSNFWAVDGDVDAPNKRYFLDYESLQSSLTFAYGMTDRFEIEFEYQGRSRFGGDLDGLSQGFHDLFGIEQNGRDLVPHGAFRLDLNPGDGRPAVSLESSDRGTFSRTIGVALQHNLTCGTRRLPAIAYSVTVRHDLRDRDLLGGRDLDVGLSISASRRFKKIYLYGSYGYTWFGQDNFRGLELRNTQWSAMVALEWRIRPRVSLLFQSLTTAGLVDDFDPFDERADEFTVGFKWELFDRGVVEAGLIENFISFDNTPDVGFHAGFRQRF